MDILTPNDYYEVLEMVHCHLLDGTLILITGTSSLEDIQPGKPWPADYIEHVFGCSGCTRRFRLAVETYHGAGGTWAALSNLTTGV